MPTYVFQCLDCQESFDVRASMREKEAGLAPECPRCNGPHVRQLITGTFVVGSNRPPNPLPTTGRGCWGGGPGSGCCG